MKEKPILFSGPMVRAILAGKKTQTRRVMQLPVIQQTLEILDIVEHGDEWLLKVRDENLFVAHLGDPKLRLRSPYGAPGDRLWVRETWARSKEHIYYRANTKCRVAYGAPLEYANGYQPGICDKPQKDISVCEFCKETEGHMKWKPSIFMPRNISRITLEVVNIRVGRLHDISEEDAMAEGCFYGNPHHHWKNELKDFFHRIWDSINAKRPGCSWADNPWVWVVEFKRVEQ